MNEKTKAESHQGLFKIQIKTSFRKNKCILANSDTGRSFEDILVRPAVNSSRLELILRASKKAEEYL